MLLKYLAGIWTAVAPAVGNHLWQSTLFAITAGLLTLALRRNRAQVRYGPWLAASLKFLVPFSVLVAMGSRLRWSRGSAEANAGLSFVMQGVGRPFMQPTTTAVSPATPSTILAGLIHMLPALLVVWLCGFLVVVFLWFLRWRRISAAIRQATPLQEGREVQAMRRLEHIGGIRKPAEIAVEVANPGEHADIDLKWLPDPSEFPLRPAYLPFSYQPDPSSPPLLVAIQQQLGLKLESKTGPRPASHHRSCREAFGKLGGSGLIDCVPSMTAVSVGCGVQGGDAGLAHKHTRCPSPARHGAMGDRAIPSELSANKK
jgi:hypothetical protein